MRCALAAWSWSGIIWAAVVILAWAGHVTALEGLQAAEGNRVLFTFGDPNYASTYWDVTIFVVFASRVPSRRWMRVTGYLLLVWALALTESNGGALALLIAIAFMLTVAAYSRRGWVGASAVVLSVGLAVTVFFTVFPLDSIRQWALDSGQPLLVNSIGRSAQSSAERSLLVAESKDLFQLSGGLLGLGPASTKPLLTTLQYQYANEAHDDFLAALVERGPVGLLGLLVVIGTAVWGAVPLVHRPLSARFAEAVPVPAGLVAGLLALAVNAFYEEILHFRFLWAILGILAVLGHDARNRWPGTAGG
jgi:O-antigen ligase